MQPPPGGPPDALPPAIVSVSPDSGTVAEGLKDPAVIRFDEVIDERSGGGLDKLVSISPVPERIDIDWRRTALAVRPHGGWLPDAVYHVTLLPGIMDLRNNRLDQGRTVVFTTGGPVPDARISGTVIDWEAGRIGARALVQAILQPDSLVYQTQADSSGEFTLSAIPPGRYLVVATIDGNNNRRAERREPFDSSTIVLDTVVTHMFWAFRRDTVGPQLARANLTDSVTVRIEFNQMLAHADPDSNAVRVLALPDSAPLAVTAVWRQSVYDSLKAAGAPAVVGVADTALRADTVRADTAVADTARAPGRVPGRAAADTAVARDTTRAARDTTRAAQLLRQRPKLSNTLVIRVERPLSPGSRYLISAIAVNLTGAAATSRTVLVIPARQERPPRADNTNLLYRRERRDSERGFVNTSSSFFSAFSASSAVRQLSPADHTKLLYRRGRGERRGFEKGFGNTSSVFFSAVSPCSAVRQFSPDADRPPA